jgi:hypothetical protein
MLNTVAILFHCLRSLLRIRAEVEAENVLLRHGAAGQGRQRAAHPTATWIARQISEAFP